MGKPPGFSEPYVSPNIDKEKEMAEHGVSPKAVKVVYIIAAILVAILAVLLMVALHVPSGESP